MKDGEDGGRPWRPTPNFRDRLKQKNPKEQGRVMKCVERLIVNPRHPGLHTHRVQGYKGVFEARVDGSLRLTFEWDGPVIVFRNNCRHDETLNNP